ncbi:hypothetical protein PR048_016938 [Dryococelus australis]|uniref:Uncharacterized protein n=1 Tax=Dryococelus australis TaxID=614101 RepID=A0ABQ9H852_9NEOP|nr:hypothetical protein PR048_016938 [Dryococelus australis]
MNFTYAIQEEVMNEVKFLSETCTNAKRIPRTQKRRTFLPVTSQEIILKRFSNGTVVIAKFILVSCIHRVPLHRKYIPSIQTLRAFPLKMYSLL